MSDPTLFGLLIIERDPYTFADFPGLLQAWLQDAGGFAFVGLTAYFLYVMKSMRGGSEAGATADAKKRMTEHDQYRMPLTTWMLAMYVLAIIAFAGYGFLVFTGKGLDTTNFKPITDQLSFVKYQAPKFATQYQPIALMAGGLFAILGIAQPFVASLRRDRFGRIWALSKLCYKEAVRSWVFWVYLLVLIPFLFPVKWFLPTKPEDELRSIISASSRLMQVLLLLPAAMLASFAIPNDIKNQNIYTVVSKPVERFEIVLGRFFGYTFLMSVALLGMTLVSWLFIQATSFGDSKKSRAEVRNADDTRTARVPVRGTLVFASRKGQGGDSNVGREFDYRKYIGGDPSTSQRAIWSFAEVPSRLATGREHVPIEFTFDIFRMTKGEENRGVGLTIRVVSWQCPQRAPTEPRDGVWKWADTTKQAEYEEAARTLVAKLPGVSPQAAKNPAAILAQARPGDTAKWAVVNELAEKFGFYEITSKEIFDYHADAIDVPVGVFKSARAGAPKGADGQPTPPRLQVYVKCESAGQMLGVAEGDLYLLEGERSFDENYFKASFGLWCRVTLVIGLAVTCSTYLAGVISFLVTILIFVAGYATEHLQDMASGRTALGGPFKAVNNLLQAGQPTMQLDPSSPLSGAIEVSDRTFSWAIRRFINIVPDVYAYSWTDFLSEGFNIPAEGLVMNFVLLVGYLLPWLVLGYYLMRSREVAA